MHYLDNAATTPVLGEVKDAMLAFLDEDFGNPSSVHAYGRKAKEAVRDHLLHEQAIGELAVSAGFAEMRRKLFAGEAGFVWAASRIDNLPPMYGLEIAFAGRSNVGKSSLVNAFLGRDRVIVSPDAGTTRDAIDTPIEVDGRPMLLIDTAGIRRGAKVQESGEYYTALRSQRAAERADVALVICDANDGVTSQDLRIAELAMKANCATALVLNKWDLTSGDEFDLERERKKGVIRAQLVLLFTGQEMFVAELNGVQGKPVDVAQGTRRQRGLSRVSPWNGRRAS